MVQYEGDDGGAGAGAVAGAGGDGGGVGALSWSRLLLIGDSVPDSELLMVFVMTIMMLVMYNYRCRSCSLS